MGERGPRRPRACAQHPRPTACWERETDTHSRQSRTAESGSPEYASEARRKKKCYLGDGGRERRNERASEFSVSERAKATARERLAGVSRRVSRVPRGGESRVRLGRGIGRRTSRPSRALRRACAPTLGAPLSHVANHSRKCIRSQNFSHDWLARYNCCSLLTPPSSRDWLRNPVMTGFSRPS